MSSTAKSLIIAAVVAVLGVGAFLAFGGGNDNKNETTEPTTQTQTQPSQSSNDSTSNQSNSGECLDNKTASATVTYTNNGFEPATSTIKVNGFIKFVNNSDNPFQLDSDPHPVHTDEPELNVGEIPKGSSCTITITEKGDWGFHNHLNSVDRARVTVN